MSIAVSAHRDRLVANLAPILAAYAEHRRRKRDTPSEPPSELSVFTSLDPEARIPPRWESGILEAKRDPVRFALRSAAREVGWEAFAIGGRELMDAVAEALEQGTAALDHWWDGIGGWTA